MTKPIVLFDIESVFSDKAPDSTRITEILNSAHKNSIKIIPIASTFSCDDHDREEDALNTSSLNPEIIGNVIGLFNVDNTIFSNVLTIIDKDEHNPLIEEARQKSKEDMQHFFPNQPEELARHLSIETPPPPGINPPA